MKPSTLVAACLLATGCASVTEPAVDASVSSVSTEPVVRVVLVGDVMTGRGIARVMETEPDEVFAGVRHLLSAADIAAGNLESPLTLLPHTSPNENMLEADPDSAAVLAAAGFDLMSLPNNHSMDAGGGGLLDSIAAIDGAGMMSVGGGATATAAAQPATLTIGKTTIGFLAYDATGVGTPAGPEPGVASWDPNIATAAVQELREHTDVVIVSVHGGAEYLPVPDAGMAEIAETLTAAGADVVWGHGAHVVHDVSVTDGLRPTVVATSLGNFLFDQAGADRTTGNMLELMVNSEGVVAYRVGETTHRNRRVEFVEWLDPVGDAGWMEGSWWSLTGVPATVSTTPVALDSFRHGDLTMAKTGDINGDGVVELIASFRRPHRSTPFMETHPEVEWTDAEGRSAHLGVYEEDTLNEIWVAGSVLLPIVDLEVCDQTMAVIHDQLDDPGQVAGGAWTWNGFGFDTAPDIPGSGLPTCGDVDGDGDTEPVILFRR